MRPAPRIHNEDQRLAMLRDLLVLDTPPEERFDRITRFAAEQFDVPIALISLVDENRQWFKSRIGLDACETSRDISFCAHALAANAPLVIEDAAQDERFHDNPLVTGAPFIRFYAGAPLELEPGIVLGTLCLIDHAPRDFDLLDAAILGNLRELVVEELRRRRAEAA
jgi:GAF domain-containing protein